MAKRVTVTMLAVVATVVTFYLAQAVDGAPQIFAVMGDPSVLVFGFVLIVGYWLTWPSEDASA